MDDYSLLSYELCYLSGFINVNSGVTFVPRCEGESVRTVCDPLATVYIYTYHELFFVLGVSMKLLGLSSTILGCS